MADVTIVEPVAVAPLEAARSLSSLIRASADAADSSRELPVELAHALADAGMFRLLVPRSLAGAELALPAYLDVIEELAKADASTAWCVNQGAVFATNAAFVSPSTARTIWSDPRAVIANGPSPSAEAVVVDGGYRVTGRWAFSSGIGHAPWLAGLAFVVENGERRRRTDGREQVRHMLFRKDEAEVHDTWQVQGLRGTGSHQFSVADLFVPEARSVWTYGDPARESGPLYVFPMVLLFASGFASVAVGLARAALDALLELAHEKRPRGDRTVLRDQAMTQMQVGQAEGTLRAARAYLHQTVSEVWGAVCEGGRITLEQRVQLRLATTHAIRCAAAVVDSAYNAGGADAIYTSSPLHRRFQDIHVITQHLQGRPAHYEAAGRHFLGLDPDSPWL